MTRRLFCWLCMSPLVVRLAPRLVARAYGPAVWDREAVRQAVHIYSPQHPGTPPGLRKVASFLTITDHCGRREIVIVGGIITDSDHPSMVDEQLVSHLNFIERDVQAGLWPHVDGRRIPFRELHPTTPWEFETIRDSRL